MIKMKTKRFIVGIVTTLLCAIAIFSAVLAPEAKPRQQEEVRGNERILVLPNATPGLMHKFFERAGAYDAANFQPK